MLPEKIKRLYCRECEFVCTNLKSIEKRTDIIFLQKQF